MILLRLIDGFILLVWKLFKLGVAIGLIIFAVGVFVSLGKPTEPSEPSELSKLRSTPAPSAAEQRERDYRAETDRREMMHRQFRESTR